MKKKYTYLIVEDDPSFASILKLVTAKIPDISLISTANNTVDAAKQINQSKPDILLLDINISGLEGPEILELSEHHPKTIMISSHPEEIMENYEVEYVTFLQKPLKNAQQLINAVRKCIHEIERR